MTDKVKVIFVANTEARQGGMFEAGEVVEMSRASAQHWLARKKVELVEGSMKRELKAELSNGESRAEVIGEIAEQIGELANAEVDSTADVAGQDSGSDGDGAEPDVAAVPAGKGGPVAAPKKNSGAGRK